MCHFDEPHERCACARKDDALLVSARTLHPHRAARIKACRGIDRHAHIVRCDGGGQLGFHPHVGAGHGVPGVAEIQVQPIDSAVEDLLAGDVDDRASRIFPTAYCRRVWQQWHLVHIALTGDERHRVPGDGRVLSCVEPHAALKRVVVFDIEFELQPREIGPRQVAATQVVEVVVSVPPAEHREVVGRLEDARDGDAGFGGVVHGGGRRAASEPLRLEVPAGIEDVDWFKGHAKIL
jgi:hypothetical protein